MSKFVVAYQDPATPYQISYTTMPSSEQGKWVAPSITKAAQDIIDVYTGVPNFAGLTVACHKSNGVAGTVNRLGGTSAPYTFYPGAPSGSNLIVRAINTQPNTAVNLGSNTASTPDWGTIVKAADGFMGLAAGVLATGSLVIPQLRPAAYAAGAAYALFSGINNICQNMTNGGYNRQKRDGLQIVVYVSTEILNPTNITNPIYGDNNSTLIGMVNTIYNSNNTNISTVPAGANSALLDCLQAALEMSRGLMGGSQTFLDTLLSNIATARTDATGVAFNNLMASIRDKVNGMLANLFDEAMKQNVPETSSAIEDLAKLFTAGNEDNIFTQDLYPNYFAVRDTPSSPANLAEVLVNNPWPYYDSSEGEDTSRVLASNLVDNTFWEDIDIQYCTTVDFDEFSNTYDLQAVSNYVGIKVPQPNQYGQIGSTTFVPVDSCIETDDVSASQVFTFIGGDNYISKHAVVRKYPIYTDWLYDVPFDTLVDYRNYRNTWYPRFWFDNLDIDFAVAYRFDNRYESGDFVQGRFYVHASGVAHFWCESEFIADYRESDIREQTEFYPKKPLTDLVRSDRFRLEPIWLYNFALLGGSIEQLKLSSLVGLENALDPNYNLAD